MSDLRSSCHRPGAGVRRACILLALLAVPLAARPAQADEARVITFREAVRIALEHNATLRQARNASRLDTVAVAEARQQFLPDLRLSTQGARNYGRNFSESEGRIVERSTQSASFGLSSSVVLFDGFGNVAAVREARLRQAAGELDVRRTEETVVFAVASNFLALIREREQLRVQRENLEAEQALDAQIGAYVEAGARTIADQYQQQASVASARFAVVEAERASELAAVDLVETLHLDPRGNYDFVAPEPSSAGGNAEPLLLAGLIERALAQRADVRAGEARIAAAEQALRVARSAKWPTVSLTTGYGSAYNSASDASFADQLEERRGGSVGLNVTIPLYERGSVRAATRRAEIAQDEARLALDQERQQAGLQVRRAHLDFNAAREQLDAAQAQQRAAERAVEASEARYQAGAATLVELARSRAVQVESASALVSARYNLLFQRILVDYYLGELDPAAMTSGSPAP